eukprot:gnl/TRDRNA2_/TRDRNA2_199982_c0_seq1.p1 gnl/TRDRNA2_/TRDRNA2_199982_c0~~gnl/TRDRNA2_/TRDRNA2_199982_c0_seq1.p1  ORF type:complete len:307 (-),score=54.27 gnl/TRDRNA2_/TRDRNA2_199982_c0_seq1:108-1028(-)
MKFDMLVERLGIFGGLSRDTLAAIGACLLCFMIVVMVLLLLGWEEIAAAGYEALVTGERAAAVHALGFPALFAFAILVPTSCTIPVMLGETIPLWAGFFTGWLRGSLLALSSEMLALVCLAYIGQSSTGAEVQEKLLEGSPVISRLAAQVTRVLNSVNGDRLGMLLGFLAAPAVAKDLVAAILLRVPPARLVMLRLPSATFYTFCFAYFGHKARVIAQGAPWHAGADAKALSIHAEIGFGFVLAVVLALAAVYAQRELGALNCSEQWAGVGGLQGSPAHAYVPLQTVLDRDGYGSSSSVGQGVPAI